MRRVLTGDDVVGHSPHDAVPADGRVQPVEADREIGSAAAHPCCTLDGEAHRSVHRHREGNGLSPIRRPAIEWLDGEVEGADVVACSAKSAGGDGDVERLMAELIGGDDQDSHTERC